MSNSANDIQVGGDHYRKLDANYQHWDFVVDAGLGYLEGCATKYLARHASKNGRQDLEKAAHYVQKMIDCADQSRIRPTNGYEGAHDRVKVAVNRFVATVEGAPEKSLVFLLATWQTVSQLRTAFSGVQHLAESSYPTNPGAEYVNQG